MGDDSGIKTLRQYRVSTVGMLRLSSKPATQTWPQGAMEPFHATHHAAFVSRAHGHPSVTFSPRWGHREERSAMLAASIQRLAESGIE